MVAIIEITIEEKVMQIFTWSCLNMASTHGINWIWHGEIVNICIKVLHNLIRRISVDSILLHLLTKLQRSRLQTLALEVALTGYMSVLTCLFSFLFLSLSLSLSLSPVSLCIIHLDWTCTYIFSSPGERLKVSFCDWSSSLVRHPSVNIVLKRHLLLNRWVDFEIILQACSLGDPLPKLPKWFCYAKEIGRPPEQKIEKPLNDISSQANGPISK